MRKTRRARHRSTRPVLKPPLGKRLLSGAWYIFKEESAWMLLWMFIIVGLFYGVIGAWDTIEHVCGGLGWALGE